MTTTHKLHQFTIIRPDFVEKIENKAYDKKMAFAQREIYLKALERVRSYENAYFNDDWFHAVINRNVYSWENRYPMVNCRNWYRKDWSTFF